MNIRYLVSLIFSLIAVFLIGSYSEATIRGSREIEPYQWGMTSFFGLILLLYFLKEYKEISK